MIKTFLIVALGILMNVKLTAQVHNEAFIGNWLKAYNSASSEVMQAFIIDNYQARVSDSTELVESFRDYFLKLYDEFGQLQLYSSYFDSTYQSPKYNLKGVYSNEWLSLLLVTSKSGEKLLGHGVWKYSPPQNHNTPKIKFRNLSKYLDTYLQGMAENGLFSGSILIARDDKVHYDKSFGDVGKGDQIKIASVSKLFTSIAIVQLVQQGHISINDPISKYVKEYPSDISQQVTIKHLLLHTSGIELDDNRNFVNKSRFATSLEELINLQVNYLDSLNEGRRMNFKPLENYDYSNEGYDLLGYIVEVVSGRSFDEFLWHNIFKKLDLRNTGFDVANAVQGLSHYKDLKYNYVPGKLFNTEQFDFNYPSPSGGIYSTTSDLFKFYKAIQKSKLFEGEWMNVLLAESVSTGEDSKYGFGIMKRSEQGYRVVGHHGSLPGANAAVYYLTDPKIYIVILSNREDQAMRLFSHLLRRVSFKT